MTHKCHNTARYADKPWSVANQGSPASGRQALEPAGRAFAVRKRPGRPSSADTHHQKQRGRPWRAEFFFLFLALARRFAVARLPHFHGAPAALCGGGASTRYPTPVVVR